MIGYLMGKLVVIGERALLLTSAGVGYQVFVGSKILAGGEQENIELFIHSHIREDRFELYGFVSVAELKIFELLLGVSGCGPKTALLIASGGAGQLQQAIQNANVSYFTAFPRVGKKLAQKLIIELKTKLGGVKDLDLTPKSPNYTDALEALLTLGFSEDKITTVLAGLETEGLTSGEIVKRALKLLR